MGPTVVSAPRRCPHTTTEGEGVFEGGGVESPAGRDQGAGRMGFVGPFEGSSSRRILSNPFILFNFKSKLFYEIEFLVKIRTAETCYICDTTSAWGKNIG